MGFRLLTPSAAYGVIVLALDRSSAIQQWLSTQTSGGFDIGGKHFAASWASTPVDVVAVALVLALTAPTAFIASRMPITFANTFDRASITVTITAILIRLRVLLLLTLAACASVLLLLHVGLAEISPKVRPDQEVGATIEWYAWHLADTIPFLDVPRSLNWSPRVEFGDAWSGILLVAVKINLVTVLLLPINLLVQLHRGQASVRSARSDAQPVKSVERRYRF